MPALLYAVILAQATNLGLSGMARASQFGYQQLEWAWEQYCREPTLTAASASLVDHHYGLPLTQSGSPAGCPPPTASGSPPAAAGLVPRRCRATSGTATAACRSTHGRLTSTASTPARSITATVRDATHTLDGILDNQTVLPVEEHTTDTHGYYRYVDSWLLV